MINIILSIFLLTTSYNFFEKVDEFKIEEKESMESIFFNYFISMDNTIYTYDKNINENKEFVLKPMYDKSKNKYYVKLPESILIPNISKDNISTATYSNDELVVIYRTHILNYIKKNNKFELVKINNVNSLFEQDLKSACHFVLSDENYIVGLEDFYRTYNNDKYFYYWYIDKRDSNNKKFVNLPIPKGFYWTVMQPRMIIDYKDEKILTSDLTEYSLKIYNLSGELTDSIKRNIPHWFAQTRDVYSRKPTAQQLYYAMQKHDSTRSLIHKVNFVDANTIFVCYSHKFKDDDPKMIYHLFYDLWVKNLETNTWELKFSDLDDEQLKKSEKLTANSGIGNNYSWLNGKLLSFHTNYDNEEPYDLLIRELKK